ncbi:MAG: amidohydrolase family protein, partial [Myxococcota bacterium]
DAPKHAGISILIVDMKRSGIRMDPLDLISDHDIHAVFFDDVRVPATSLAGRENEGWKLITGQLNQERVTLCSSGILERFPALRFGSIEAGIGWVPWALTAMDEAYVKHHMWVRPRLAQLPSEAFRERGFASFQEDAPGLELAVEHGLVDNFLWANDYPHHEGTWPHSAAAIERTMGGLDDASRAKILGENAARIFKFDRPS